MRLLYGWLFCLLCGAVCADQVIITTSADTTLIEAAASNNLGAATFVNAGTTQNYTKNRGLFQFDIAGNIPRGARITRGELVLEVTRSPSDGFAASLFHLHRLRQPWGEGNKVEPLAFPGLGVNATTNEATWNDRFAFAGMPWSVPGAGVTNDYAATPSAGQFIYDVGDSPYYFGPTPEMTADVQSWLDDPATNHGWLLKTSDEAVNFTARRFGSREDVNRSPLLYIEYLPPLLFAPPLFVSNRVHLTFTAEAGRSYFGETRGALAADESWQTATNFGAYTERTTVHWSIQPSAGRQFFRLREE